MNLTISGHHLEVTPALRGYVIQKLDRVMRHFDQVVDVRVLLSVEKQKEKEENAQCTRGRAAIRRHSFHTQSACRCGGRMPCRRRC